MNEIEKLVEQVKLSTDYQINKRLLREKMQTSLHFTHNSGMFKITAELLGFVSTWPHEHLILEDVYNNPIKVDKSLFLQEAQQTYSKTMQEWLDQHDKIKRFRKV